ncbi:cell adhesion molecule CEACAM1-like [Halichoeres trimaculatus]|uniref:cell adhesion molecule CEACAM1-like n=1 Tax=Halichoeres trimaculatus TaxID=147232 RepID=UPI003D9E77A9
MKYKLSLLLLKLLHIASLEGLQTDKFEVTGYVGRDVKLPCYLTKGKKDRVVQVEWKLLLQPENKMITIIVSNGTEGAPADTFLKDRVNVSEQSLIIKNVTVQDAGSYTCLLTTFPSGSLKGTTNLVIQELPEQMSLSTGGIAGIVISVILLLVILTAVAYFIFIRRQGSFVRHNVVIDTDSPVRDVLRPSVLFREQDVVYSDVKSKPSRTTAPSSNDQHAKAGYEVTYSEIVMSRGVFV